MMERLLRHLGRTYHIVGTGLMVRVSSIDERSVRFVSTDPGIKLVNAAVTHDEFFQLNLEEV